MVALGCERNHFKLSWVCEWSLYLSELWGKSGWDALVSRAGAVHLLQGTAVTASFMLAAGPHTLKVSCKKCTMGVMSKCCLCTR